MDNRMDNRMDGRKKHSARSPCLDSEPRTLRICSLSLFCLFSVNLCAPLCLCGDALSLEPSDHTVDLEGTAGADFGLLPRQEKLRLLEDLGVDGGIDLDRLQLTAARGLAVVGDGEGGLEGEAVDGLPLREVRDGLAHAAGRGLAQQL